MKKESNNKHEGLNQNLKSEIKLLREDFKSEFEKINNEFS